MESNSMMEIQPSDYGGNKKKKTSDDDSQRVGAVIKPSTLLVKPFWKGVTSMVGMRRLTGFLKQNVTAYNQTITHFETKQPIIALTIDDGLCRPNAAGVEGEESSMVQEILDCLERYNAHATFFVCTDYLENQKCHAKQLLAKGHELGNHLEADKAFYYNKLPKKEFRSILRKTNTILDDIETDYQHRWQQKSTSAKPPSSTGRTTTKPGQRQRRHRWFRAPQFVLTKAMAEVIEEEGREEEGLTLTHAMADCYCDDWVFAQDADKVAQPEQRRKLMQQVAQLLLAQVQPGSIALLHMPQHGFREGLIDALEIFLAGLQEKGYRCVNLTELQAIAASEEQREQEDALNWLEEGSENFAQ